MDRVDSGGGVGELLASLNFDRSAFHASLNLDAGFLHAGLLAVALLACCAVCGKSSPSKRAAARPGNGASDACANSAPEVGSLPKALDVHKNEVPVVFPPYRHMHAVCWSGPDEPRFAAGNQPEPYRFENEFCWGLWLPMFRPSMDPAHDSPEGWHYGYHFQDRKRLWEHRFQLHLKSPPDGPLHFGIQLEEYVPLGRTTEKLMEVTVGMLKKAVGSATVHHSPGEDPKATQGEAELPTFAMPLWAFDQFIETPEGLPPPSLVDRDFETLGVKRSDNRKAFMEKMEALEPKPGPTYTFAFWGVAQFMDAVRWSIRGVMPGMSIDFNNFCKAPPVHCVIYAVKRGSLTEDDQRHLESRKNNYCHIAFWSTTRPISQEKLLGFFPGVSAEHALGTATKKRPRGIWACCMERGR